MNTGMRENLKKIKPNPEPVSEPVKGNEIILRQECKYGTEEDGSSMDCYWSRELFGYDHVCLRMDMGCLYGKKKKDEEC
jgi:hypothetical protein